MKEPEDSDMVRPSAPSNVLGHFVAAVILLAIVFYMTPIVIGAFKSVISFIVKHESEQTSTYLCLNGDTRCTYFLSLPDSSGLQPALREYGSLNTTIVSGKIFGVVGNDTVFLEGAFNTRDAKAIVDRYRAKTYPIRVEIK